MDLCFPKVMWSYNDNLINVIQIRPNLIGLFTNSVPKFRGAQSFLKVTYSFLSKSFYLPMMTS